MGGGGGDRQKVWGQQKGWGQKGAGKGWTQGVQQKWNSKGNSKGKNPSRKIVTAPANFSVPPTKRFTGTVKGYWKLKGYGFILLDQKGLVPEDQVFVHYPSIKSEDRYPFLVPDMKVQFNIAKEVKGGKTVLHAKNVSAPGGVAVSLQD